MPIPRKALYRTLAIVSIAFITGVSTYLAEFFGKQTTDRIIDLRSSPALLAQVLPPGTYQPASTLFPYVIVLDDTKSVENIPTSSMEDGSWDKTLRSWSDVSGSPQYVRIEFRTELSEPVIINRIEARVLTREEKRKGWFVADGACGLMPLRVGLIDFDDDRSTVMLWDENWEPLSGNLYVAREEVELLEMHAHTSKYYIEWVIDVFYSAPDGLHKMTINNDGQPFKMSSEVGSTAYVRGLEGFERYPKWDDGIEMC